MTIIAASDIKDRKRVIKTRSPKITLLIPARNEEKNLPQVLPLIPNIIDEVILVDGASTDRTNEVAKSLRPDVRILKQTRKGKGDAIRCGIEKATGDFIVMIDADGSMNPNEIPRFIEPLLNGYDFVRGSRFLPGGGTNDMEKYRQLGNKVFVWLLNILYRGNSSDLCYGYMAFRREAVNRFEIESDGFEIETELNIKALKSSLKITEVASFETKRFKGTSNLKAFRDGRRIIKTIFKLRFSDTLNHGTTSAS